MLKQKLQQKLLQKLSPQQIQMIKLLEVPTTLLEQRIKKEIEENPVLEEGRTAEEEEERAAEEENTTEKEDGDQISIEDYLSDDNIPSYKLSANNFSKDDKRPDIPFSSGSTFHDFLESQLGLRKLDDREHALAEYIIGNIDEDGYLRREIEAIVDDLAFSVNIETDEQELNRILKIIQDFEPVGVGARDLRECLLLQLKSKNQLDPIVQRTTIIIDKYFEEFTKKHYEKIQMRMDIDEEELKEAIDEILHLNPKPGSSYSDPLNKATHIIIPDFILENNEGKIEVSLNGKNTPELRISRQYSNMLESYIENKKKKQSREQKDAITFVKQKLDSAKWFIDAIKQRQNTLQLTMDAILEYQYEYFLDGDETKLRPMILKDIADITELDISTISRVANSKYIQTHFGIFPLKFFFSEGLQTDSGEEVSTREIKKILQDCISAEEKRKPLTDEKLSEILKEKGYLIARRTVAKYREQLNIPVARMRKEL